MFSQVRISHVLRCISICGLFTDSPSYHSSFHPTLYILDSEGVVTEHLVSGWRVTSSGAMAITALREGEAQ
jgi:hypothetical protein